MSKKKHRSRTVTKRPVIQQRTMPGAEPGFFDLGEREECPLVRVFSYNQTEYHENLFNSTETLFKYLDAETSLVHWVDVSGYGNKNFFSRMANRFGLHDLQIEDVVSQQQRPKVEEFDTHLFILSRMKYTNAERVFIDEQISLFVFENLVLSFQDYEEDCLQPVRDRLKKVNSRIRQNDAFFLAYSIQDAIIDNYFPLLDILSDALTELENEILANPGKEVLTEMQNIKRLLIDLRKSIWPEKDKMNELLRSHYRLVKPEYEIYLRDTYDHCVQIMDLIETNKEIAHSIMDVYLNSVNNKLSEVMKVLTVISSVFIPLTFIAGVYGMNFSAADKTGKELPFNMPELYHPWGYAAIMVLMLFIAIAQLLYFKRKKWL